jgi:hypothetical protein
VTDAAGTEVIIRSYCFGPTIVRVAPGSTVTWSNRDAAPHTVLGANAAWGSFENLARSDHVTYRFVRDGVYPYVCTYHAGMIGSVVVGDGTGPGAAGTPADEDGPVTLVPAGTHGAPLVARPVAMVEVRPGAWRIATFAAVGALLVAVTAQPAIRRRRAAAAHQAETGAGRTLGR